MANAGYPQPTARVDSTTRVDHAHGLDGLDGPDPNESQMAEPSMDLLQAIAGFDARLANHQMRAQALELAAMLREKQRVLEQRESELNARSAVLENEWRAARLRQQAQHGSPITLESPVSQHPANAELKPPTAPEAERATVTQRRIDADHPQTADQLFAHDESLFAWHVERPTVTHPASLHVHNERTFSSETHASHQSNGRSTDDSTDTTSSLELDLESKIDLHPQETKLDFDFQREWEQLQEYRRQLQQKESSLQRRELHLEHTHEEVMTLHREAIEMRLATEQSWADLLPHLSRPELTQSIARLRTQLADHYRLAHDSLHRRKEELIELRDQLQQQDQRLRQHRREIQLWADRRYDELEARVARLAVRERELDLVEADLQSQSLQWQRQRELYREEIERLSWQVRDHNLATTSN